MKYSTTKKSLVKRRVFYIMTLLVLCLGIVLGYLLLSGQLFKHNEAQTPSQSTTTEDSSDADDITPTDTPQTDSPLKTNPETSGEQAVVNPIVTISANNQTKTTYQVRAFVNTVTSKGTCTLTMEKGQQKIIRTSDVQAGPSFTTCKGFDLPLSELSTGDWVLTVMFANSDISATTSKTVGIN